MRIKSKQPENRHILIYTILLLSAKGKCEKLERFMKFL